MSDLFYALFRGHNTVTGVYDSREHLIVSCRRIIILSCHLHGYPSPSVSTPPYCSSLLVGPQGHNPYHHRAAVCRVELVALLLLGYVRESIGTSLMSSSLLLQQCPVCLVRLTLIVFVMGGRWLYSWCFVGCSLQDLFKIARSILV